MSGIGWKVLCASSEKQACFRHGIAKLPVLPTEREDKASDQVIEYTSHYLFELMVVSWAGCMLGGLVRAATNLALGHKRSGGHKQPDGKHLGIAALSRGV